MPTTTLMEVRTFGDYCTLPGGIALRDRADESQGPRFIIQKFTTDRETGLERHYFRTNYAETLAQGLEAFAEDVRRAATYQTGGSLNLTGRYIADNPEYPDYAKGGAHDPYRDEVAA